MKIESIMPRISILLTKAEDPHIELQETLNGAITMIGAVKE
jgi:hypothetical protein